MSLDLMARRTLFERDALTISERPGAELSPGHRTQLARLESALPKGSIAWTAGGVKLGSHCGVLRLGGETIEILPKIFRDGQATEQNRALLLHLLMLSRRLPWLKNWQGGLDQQRHHLLDVFIKKFCDDLHAVLVGGLARNYRERTEEMCVISGRLDLVDHLRRPPGNKQRMVCRFDEFDEDIPMNRILRYCIERLSNLVRLASLRNSLDELRYRFDDASPITFRPAMLADVRIDRTLIRFQDVWNQCCWLLRGLYPDAVAGETPHASLLFDMETLFEEGVSRLLLRELDPEGYECRLQGPQQWILSQPDGTGLRRRMKPDISLKSPTGRKIIVDCKWKLLDGPGDLISQLSHADLYQVHTYATEYEAKAVALVFPWVPGLPEMPVEMRFNTVGIPVWFHFVNMDVFNRRKGLSLTENWSGILKDLV